MRLYQAVFRSIFFSLVSIGYWSFWTLSFSEHLMLCKRNHPYSTSITFTNNELDCQRSHWKPSWHWSAWTSLQRLYPFACLWPTWYTFQHCLWNKHVKMINQNIWSLRIFLSSAFLVCTRLSLYWHLVRHLTELFHLWILTDFYSFLWPQTKFCYSFLTIVSSPENASRVKTCSFFKDSPFPTIYPLK